MMMMMIQSDCDGQHDSTHKIHSSPANMNIPLYLQVEGLDPAANTDGETLDH